MAKKRRFVDERVYRQLRFRDFLRAMPVFALFLFMLPLLFTPDTTDIVHAGTYLLIVWSLLIFISAVLSFILRYDDLPED